MFTVNFRVVLAPVASVTVSENEDFPLAVGVPDRVALRPSAATVSVSPAGRLPERVQV